MATLRQENQVELPKTRTARRLTIFRGIMVMCFIATLLLPGLLLSMNAYSSKPAAIYSVLRIHGISQGDFENFTQQRRLRIKQSILDKKSAGAFKPVPDTFVMDSFWTGGHVMGLVPPIRKTVQKSTSHIKINTSNSIDLPRQFVRRMDLSQRPELQGISVTRQPRGQVNVHGQSKALVPQVFSAQMQSITGNKTLPQSVSSEVTVTFNDNSTTNANALVCQEVHKVAFVKTHKTGGTTVMNVIQRFGHVRDLVFAFPRSGNYLGFGQTVNPRTVLPPPKGKTYDLLINHVMYNRLAFQRIMPRQSVYITIIRHPLEQLVSAIEYLKKRVNYLMKLSAGNPVSDYLQNPAQHETADYKWSFTNNRMSFDLGLEHRFFHETSLIDNFIKKLDHEFKLVMITGHMDESLLLLKRYLCWGLKDILYVPRNVNGKKMKYNFTSAEQERHQKWAEADYKLYNFFLGRFWNQVAAEGDDFPKELNYFKGVLSKVKTHCIWVNKTKSSKTLTIESSAYNPSFVLQKIDCDYMLMEEIPFLIRSRKKHLDNIKRSGIDAMYKRTWRRPGATYRLRNMRRPKRYDKRRIIARRTR